MQTWIWLLWSFISGRHWGCFRSCSVCISAEGCRWGWDIDVFSWKLYFFCAPWSQWHCCWGGLPEGDESRHIWTKMKISLALTSISLALRCFLLPLSSIFAPTQMIVHYFYCLFDRLLALSLSFQVRKNKCSVCIDYPRKPSYHSSRTFLMLVPFFMCKNVDLVYTIFVRIHCRCERWSLS